MKDYIVDASVVAKWLLPEPGRDLAKMLIDAPCSLRAPDLIMAELTSIMLKRIVRKEMTRQESTESLQRFIDDYLDNRIRVIPSRLLAEKALQIANDEKQSTYDSLYLALAVQARCQFITADEKLIVAIKDRQLRKHLIALDDPALKRELLAAS